jgi:predicted ribosome quality control (RQC) complex YloA/Tae2 family protein
MLKIPTTISHAAISTITGATGRITKDDEGKTIGILTLETSGGPQEMLLSTFDGIYKGFVNCWPAVHPLKQEVVSAQREETKAEKAKEREEAIAAKEQEKAAAKAKREEEQAAIKAAKEKEKADAKAKKDKELADAKVAKEKADAAKLKTAADAKAKADKVSGTATPEKAAPAKGGKK